MAGGVEEELHLPSCNTDRGVFLAGEVKGFEPWSRNQRVYGSKRLETTVHPGQGRWGLPLVPAF